MVVSAAVDAMKAIDESSRKISDIASAVDEVAFQTNLLSVNAAIEAARAGEEGKSFGVVADEIRALARRSAESAHSIRNLIRDSISTVERGSSAIEDSGQTLRGLSSSVHEVTDFVTRIVVSSEEQSLGVEQVLSGVLQMDKVTQANAEEASKLTSAAKSLSSQALDLQAMLRRFTLDGQSLPAVLSSSAR
jgi:methyl-accepting chemotaxis protein